MLTEENGLPRVLDRVQGWTMAADQKIAVITAVQTLACGFLLPELRDWLASAFTSTIIRSMLFVSGAFLVLGVGLSLRALFPNIDNPGVPSVTFFGNIHDWSLDDYRKRLDSMDAEAWKRDYVSQIHMCSLITVRKYRLMQRAVSLFVIGLIIVGVCYVAAIVGL